MNRETGLAEASSSGLIVHSAVVAFPEDLFAIIGTVVVGMASSATDSGTLTPKRIVFFGAKGAAKV